MNEHEGRTFEQARAEIAARNVTAADLDPAEERFRLYRLCECTACIGSGKKLERLGTASVPVLPHERCPDCRGEGRTRELVATATDPESVGVALVTLGREGEWDDCPIGLMDAQGETGHKWLVRPWLASPRNVSDAAKLMRAQQREKP